VGCSFNLPKASARAMAVDAMTSVTRLLEEVPLSPEERAAAEGDMTALDGMLAKLRDAPALDGRTPQEIYSAKNCPSELPWPIRWSGWFGKTIAARTVISSR
jgi:hypothetical protein